MVVYLYNINKRPNSTKIPLPSDGVSFQCQLKEETSFMNPVLIFSKDNLSSGVFSPALYNYAQIIYWERFYYITDWVYLNGVWEAHLTVDVLGSFKTQIGNTTAYIVRSASANNGNIIDNKYPAKTDIAITKVNVACSWYGVAPSGGTYIVGVINKESSGKVGSVSYYALTTPQMGSLLAFLYGDTIFQTSNITEMGIGLFKSMFNPMQYIVSCAWFPFALESFGSQQTTLFVGYWSTGINAIVVSNLAQKTYITATIPNHPQISRGAFLNHAPYTKISLFIPPFGEIPIDTNYIEIGKYIYSACLIDHITGQATLRVAISESSSSLDEYNVITERTSMIGIPIQISQVLTDYVQTVQSISSGLTSLQNLNVGGLISSVVSAVDSQMPKVTSSGANGSFITHILAPVLMVEHLKLTDEDNTEFGRPLFAVRTINTLSGYIECGESDHGFGGTKAENDEINQYLKNGFFYE